MTRPHRLRPALVAGLLLGACAYGPETEKKSMLNYLSGEHYEASGPTVADVPVVKELDEVKDVPLVEGVPLLYKRKAVSTVIRGRAMVSEFQPLKFKALELRQQDTVLLTTTSDHLGVFRFSAILPSGLYIIRVGVDEYPCERQIKVESYLLENIELRCDQPPAE